MIIEWIGITYMYGKKQRIGGGDRDGIATNKICVDGSSRKKLFSCSGEASFSTTIT